MKILKQYKAEQMKEPNCYIDLHVHLDGAITPAIARELSRIQKTPLLPDSDDELSRLLTVPGGCRNLTEFLQRFDLPISLLQTENSISEAVFLVQEMLRSQHIIYAELRFAPQSFQQRGLTQEQAVRAALRGLERSPLPCSLILCCMRGPGLEEANRETVRLAREYLVSGNGVTALDLAGAEGLFPTSDYRDLFALASQLNVPFTLHAGEAAGADSVRCAIEMGARRIGHGVRIAGDADVRALVARLGIPLELCPTSNFQTRAFEDEAHYPLIDFLSQGIHATLNTDDMAISGTTLAREFVWARQTLGLTASQQKILLLNAAEAAFTDTETKHNLIKIIESAYHI